MKKDWKRHIAYEVLVILVMLTLLMYLCRLWPIIFLLIIGIFIMALPGRKFPDIHLADFKAKNGSRYPHDPDA